jgi:hypothetical protein
MALSRDDAVRLGELSKLMPKVDVAHGDLMIVGNAFARPVTQLRANQAAMEAVRARLRHGEKSDVFKARAVEAAETAAMVAEVESEIDRLRVQPTQGDAEAVSVYGFVRKGGKAVTRGEVSLVLGEQALVSIQLADDGSFALSARSEMPLKLQVEVGKSIVYRDSQSVHVRGPVAMYRVVELDRGKEPRPQSWTPPRLIADSRDLGEETPTTQAPADPAAAAGLTGKTLSQSLSMLAEQSVAVSGVRVRGGGESTPKVTAVRTDTGARSVSLDVETRDGNASRINVLATLIADDPEAEAGGIATIAEARAWFKQAQIHTFEEAHQAAAGTVAALYERGGIETSAAAGKLKRALNAALAKISLED